MTRTNHNTAPFVPLSELKDQLQPGMLVEMKDGEENPYLFHLTLPSRRQSPCKDFLFYDSRDNWGWHNEAATARIWFDAPAAIDNHEPWKAAPETCLHDYRKVYSDGTTVMTQEDEKILRALQANQCHLQESRPTLEKLKAQPWPEPPFAVKTSSGYIRWIVASDSSLKARFRAVWFCDGCTEKDSPLKDACTLYTPQPGDLIPLWPAVLGTGSRDHPVLSDSLFPTVIAAKAVWIANPELRLALELPPVWVRKER